MGRKAIVVLPKLQRVLKNLGENIRLARLRRTFSASIVAQRAGISVNTLRAIECGNPNVSFGAYASVLFCLGLENDINLLAGDDELGRKLQDANLPTKARSPRRRRLAEKAEPCLTKKNISKSTPTGKDSPNQP